ncbi:MAG: aminotransferase class III-fold pyridoxal phosphate-dependent enzyme, partial [Flavobacteriaceae bacterium]
LFADSDKKSVHFLDLSISSNWLGTSSDFQDVNYFQFKIDQLQKEHFDSIIAGGYLEHRPLYTSSAYDKIGNHGIESRCVHLGVDFWLPSQTAVFALWDGEIETVVEDRGDKTYGGLMIIKHKTDAFEFYSLYGHLSLDSIKKHKKGTRIPKGSKIAELGAPNENGNWAPHLHFQLMLTLMNFKDDFPGVAYSNQKSVWKSICPDPNLFFKEVNLDHQKKDSNHEIFTDRKLYLGKGMSLQYQNPLHIVRGEGVYLIDHQGRKYIDTVNNVAHVGHEHPRVVKKGQEQMAVLNTNSRYLHKNITKLAKTLLQTLPKNLEVIHFVNSGSEANELALRMVKTATDSNQMIVSEVGYHGNTNGCVEISSYKFDGKGGKGAPKNTHIIPIPDSFRGRFRGEETGSLYAEEVKKCIERKI